MNDLQLYNEISSLSPELKKEVEEFINKLKDKGNLEKASKRKFGSSQGFFKMAPDFDEPLEDFKEYM